jgi:hypothetical protein
MPRNAKRRKGQRYPVQSQYGNDSIQRRVLEAYSWINEELDGCVLTILK